MHVCARIGRKMKTYIIRAFFFLINAIWFYDYDGVVVIIQGYAKSDR